MLWKKERSVFQTTNAAAMRPPLIVECIFQLLTETLLLFVISTDIYSHTAPVGDKHLKFPIHF